MGIFIGSVCEIKKGYNCETECRDIMDEVAHMECHVVRMEDVEVEVELPNGDLVWVHRDRLRKLR